MTNEITLVQDIDEVLGIDQIAEADVPGGHRPGASIVETEDEDEESGGDDDED